MTTKKIVSVVGATGKLGTLVVQELLARGAKVRAIVRNPAKPEAQALEQIGAQPVALSVADADEATLKNALDGSYAMVSTLQGGPDTIIDTQLKLLNAAKAVSARRFFPSDFSYNLFTLPFGTNVNSDWRKTFAEKAEQSRGDVEVVHVMQGMFADAVVAGFMGLYHREAGAIRHWGDANAKLDWTTWEDTARFTAAAALDDRNVPAQFFISGDRKSVSELAVELRKARREVSVESLGSIEDLKRHLAMTREKEPANMHAWLPLMYALGMFEGKAALGPLENGRYPEIQAESLAAAIARGAL